MLGCKHGDGGEVNFESILPGLMYAWLQVCCLVHLFNHRVTLTYYSFNNLISRVLFNLLAISIEIINV